MGTLSNLTTTEKGSIIGAVNEVNYKTTFHGVGASDEHTAGWFTAPSDGYATLVGEAGTLGSTLALAINDYNHYIGKAVAPDGAICIFVKKGTKLATGGNANNKRILWQPIT